MTERTQKAGMSKAEAAIMLCSGHALCDYPLQGDFLAKAKNHRSPIPGVPFWQALSAHALIHSGMVYLVTKRKRLALAELLVHAATDYAKCDGRISYNQDQAIHYGCKLLWASLANRRQG